MDYDATAAKIQKLLEKFGSTVSLPRTTGSTYDPITGATVAGTDATVTTTGVLTTYQDADRDGTRVMAGDRKLILSNEQEPTPDDTPIIGGEQWTVVNIDRVQPDGATDIIFRVQVRR